MWSIVLPLPDFQKLGHQNTPARPLSRKNFQRLIFLDRRTRLGYRMPVIKSFIHKGLEDILRGGGRAVAEAISSRRFEIFGPLAGSAAFFVEYGP
jgi:hypothetical protein